MGRRFWVASPQQTQKGTMKMQIDGYTPPDAKIETETGIELEYTVTLDKTKEKFFFRVLSAGRSNTALKVAAGKKANIRDVRKKTGINVDENDVMRDAVELLFDFVVISWNTTLKSQGKPIKPSRETFIELLMMETFGGVFIKLSEDTTDLSKFTKEVEEADAKK